MTVPRWLVAGSPSAGSNTNASLLAGEVERAETLGTSTGILLSYWYFKEFDVNTLHPDCPLIADSGAFSAHTLGKTITPDEYADWLDKYPGRFDFAFNLDVIGDPAESLDQWRYLRNGRGQETLPVLHFGDKPEDWLPTYRDEGAHRIALGGLVTKGPDPRQIRAWTAYTFRWLRDNWPEAPVHGLGVHMSSRNLGAFPWATTDSATFTMAWRFARAQLWDSERQRWVKFRLDGKEPYRYGRVIRSYGFEVEEVAVSSNETRSSLVSLVIRSESRAASDHARNPAKTEKYFAEASVRDATRESHQIGPAHQLLGVTQ